MGRRAKSAAISDPVDVTQDIPRDWYGAAFQFSMACFLIASFWHLLGPEPNSALVFRLQLGAILLGYCLSIGFWVMRSRQLPMVCIPLFLLAALWAAANSAREFDTSFRVLEPAQVINDRIVHRGIGLSYAKPPNCRYDLQLIFQRDKNSKSNGKSGAPMRLGFTDKAILSRIVVNPQSKESGRRSSIIILQVSRRYQSADMIMFFSGIRSSEVQMSSIPNMRVVRHTQLSNIAGLEMVEFDVVNDLTHRLYRHVHLRKGTFQFNFSFDADENADQTVFDEFLKSIRLESTI